MAGWRFLVADSILARPPMLVKTQGLTFRASSNVLSGNVLMTSPVMRGLVSIKVAARFHAWFCLDEKRQAVPAASPPGTSGGLAPSGGSQAEIFQM